MLDYQRIVDDVRSSLDSQDIDGMDFLRAAVADYAVACDEVNERLRKCASFLRKGLRSEAIQLCEMEPNLLDAVAVLDFPERPQWADLADQYGMAPLPPLMVEVAADLNEAYALEQPLATLLKKHRLLALCHGPLPFRIRVLRQLARLDAENTVWQEDLQVFERARLKQLDAEVSAARRAGNMAAMKALGEELSTPDWTVPPAATLVKTVAEVCSQDAAAAARESLKQIAADLEAAYAEGKLEEAAALRDRWNAIQAEAGVEPDSDAAGLAAPALDWVQLRDEQMMQEAEHREALAALRRALECESSVSELYEAYCRVASLGSMPAELESEYRTRVESIERAAKLRRWLVTSGVAATCVVVVLSAVATVLYVRGVRAVASAAKAIDSLLEAGELKQAQALADKLPPYISRDPRVRTSISHLDAAIVEETRRKSAFDEKIAMATQHIDGLRKSLSQERLVVALAGHRDEVRRMHDLTADASRFAKTAEELKATNASKEAAAEVERQWRKQLDASFVERCEELEERVAALAKAKDADIKAKRAGLDELRMGLKKWEFTSKHVSPNLGSRINGIQEQMARLESIAEQREKEAMSIDRITAAIGKADSYLQAVQEFIRDNPESRHVAGFGRVGKEADSWSVPDEWNMLAARWNKSGLPGIRPDTARDEIAKVQRIAASLAEMPESENLGDIVKCLEAIAHRAGDEDRLDVSLRKIFKDPLVAQIDMLRKNTGECYYIDEMPKIDGDGQRPFMYVSDFNGGRKGSLIKKSDVERCGPAPQVGVAKQIQPLLDSLNDNTWETNFCRMIAILAKDREMDPVLKARLLQKTMDVGSRGSHLLAEAFSRHLQWFRDEKIDLFVNWLDPTDVAVAKARKDTQKKLLEFPPVDEPLNAVKQAVAQVNALRLKHYEWIGFLLRDGGGKWTCRTNHAPDAPGDLVVLCCSSSGSKPALRPVGRIDAQGATIDKAESDSLLEGRPVFLVKP